jgi:hypothetical protein
LVQFKDAKFDELPRVYLAKPEEIAERLRKASGGRGDTILYENHTRGPRAAGAGTVERIPNDWRLSAGRVDAMFGGEHSSSA